MIVEEAFIRACSCYSLGWFFGAAGLCREVLKRQLGHAQARTLLALAEAEIVKQPPCDLRFFVIGDSHVESYDGPGPVFQPVHLGPRTMHGLGRNFLAEIDLKNFGVRNGDCVTFVAGEIDVRMHIGRIRDVEDRALEIIIEQLVSAYIAQIKAAQAGFDRLDCMVASIVPPIGIEFRPDIPHYFYGESSDRAEITVRLNRRLEAAARASGLGYADTYSSFVGPDGLMNPVYLDELTHIQRDFHPVLRDILLGAYAELQG